MRDEKTMHIRDEWLVPTVEEESASALSAGRYRLCFEVASGGMATVFLSLYEGVAGFEKVVALKTIHAHLAKEQKFLDMFLDEARIAAHIDHPFVCPVLDFGSSRESYFIAMEYVVGEPISDIWEELHHRPEVAASPALPLIIARVVADLAEGLHAAHSMRADGELMNVVHRDVSPSNLFVTYDGTVRVVDFGIASADNKLHHTETGMVKGKFAYMSPEQLDMRGVDGRSDVFSLGAVMWELLTGKRLFKREGPMDTMKAVTSMDIVPPSKAREGIPEELDAIVLKALARDTEDRYASARDFALALERFLSAKKRSVPKAQVGDWLSDLFPGSESKKRQLIELTRKGESAMPLEDSEEFQATEMYLQPEPTKVRPRNRGRESTVQSPASERVEAPAAAAPAKAAKAASGGAMMASALFIAIAVIAAAAMYLRPWEPRQAPTTSPETTEIEATEVEADAGIEAAPSGFVNVAAETGWAEVLVGERSLGRTPQRVELPVGTQQLTLKPYGTGEPQTLDVDVRAGRTMYLSVSLPAEAAEAD